MSCPTFESQVAEALAKGDLNNTDIFLVLDNGTTYKVTIAELIAAIGATGDIKSIAPAGTTPVLTGSSPSFNVRGISGGDGIGVALTGQDAINIFSQLGNAGGALDGTPLIVNTAANTINWRRLKAGNGIAVTQDGNSVVITNSEVEQSSTTVVISQLTDFPAPVSGVISLAEETDYVIVNDISTSSRFTMGNNTILRSLDPRATTLTYTGNGTMFTCAEGSQVIKEISLSAPTGRLFSNNATTTGSFLMRWVRVIDCLAIGDLSKPLVGFYNVLIHQVTGSIGFTYNGVANVRLVMQQVTVLNATNAGFTFLELGTATFTGMALSIIELFNTITGQTFLSGAPAGANLPGESFGFVGQVEILGDMTDLSGIEFGDAGWEFLQAGNIPNTNPKALASLSAPAITDIVTINVPVKVNGVFTDQVSDYMTVDATGRITLTGKRSRQSSISVVLSGRPIAGTQTYSFTLAKNGVSIPDSAIEREIASGAVGVVSLAWIIQLDTADFIEVFAAGTTGNTDFETLKLIFKAT